MFANLLFLYLSIVVLVGLILLATFLLDGSTSKKDPFSWLVVMVGAALWPIALPFSVVEVFHKLLSPKKPLPEHDTPNSPLG